MTARPTIPVPYAPVEADPLAPEIIRALQVSAFMTELGDLYFDWALGNVPDSVINELGGFCG